MSTSSASPAQVIRFGSFEANFRSKELRKSGVRIKLHDQPFQVLTMLLERPGELVTREEIRNRLWPGDTYVGFDHGLNNAVNRLREALGDSADSPRFVETLPRRGYRFIAPTTLQAFTNDSAPLEIASAPGESSDPSDEPLSTPPVLHKPDHRGLIWIGLLVLVLTVVAFQLHKAPKVSSSRLFLLPPEGITFDFLGDEGDSIALSPDGARVAFVTRNSKGTAQIWVRPLGTLTSTAITESEDAAFPFWSPDGRWIGFFAGGKLKKIRSDGSASAILCDAPFGRGGSWNSSGIIIFAPTSHSGIYRVSEEGGLPTPVTRVDAAIHTTHRWPKFLPDGKHFIYLATSHFNPPSLQGIYLADLEGKENKFVVTTNADATYASGYLFYLRKEAFIAQRFDPNSAQLQGEPHETVEKVLYDPGSWKAVFDVSDKGVMAYQLGDRVRGSQFWWFDRAGNKIGALGEPAFQWEPAISRDGRRLAAGVGNGGYSNLWVYDLDHGGRTQITFSRYDCGAAIWSRDDSQLLITEKREHYRISQVDSRGAEPPRLILDVGTDIWPLDLSPDGRFLLYGQGVTIGRSRSSLWIYRMSGGKSFRLLGGDAREDEAQFSPDGKWVAYTSNESGRDEVYVVPFATTAISSQCRSAAALGKWQISFSGGQAPRWRRDGKELFYLAADNTITAVRVSSSRSRLDIGPPHSLFHVNPSSNGNTYDVSPDGSRFIVNTAPQERAAPITVVENWQSDFDK